MLKMTDSDEGPLMRELDMIADDKHCYAPFKVSYPSLQLIRGDNVIRPLLFQN